MRNRILILMLLACATLLLLGSVFAKAQAQDKQIVRPGTLDSEDAIRRFIMSILVDRTQRSDPFVAADRDPTRQVASYEVEQKPRPESGLGRYDVEQLTLKAIWEEDDEAVALVSSPDNKVFVVRLGDEAYDGRIVEIDLDGGAVKFLQELRRTGGPARPGDPDVKYVEKTVRFRR